ncbi:CYFA0S36e00584g1_1 [Cyberlindnera fabianii]|uniref:CYFA0S36e00584g1_1 n=1 Tax=Cyberlindnera fabianii TaxID=36022 RepID=A0A061BEB1_CYBFA|nr:Polyamine N-acetyltransferase 1 [Cyberlindnera fabianii]CDR47701.1 CYFA0S36e00584g1_1 [Cyberlindnera fabianii]
MSELPLHIAIRPLNLEDVDQVLALEELGFHPSERCSPEGVKYRLSACPELSSGLFVREFAPKYHKKDTELSGEGADLHVSKPKDQEQVQQDQAEKKEEDQQQEQDEDDNDSLNSYAPEAKSTIVKETLIGQVLGTKIDGDFITEESMQIPDDKESESGVKKGHVESSHTIGIHSVVVHPDYQKKNLATLMLHDYIQKLSNQEIGEKIAIIAKGNLLPFYNRLGFITKGPSKCKHGGEEWFDLHCPLVPEDDDK